MSKRLQVTLQDGEYEEMQCMARSRGITPAEWVRQVLDNARRQERLSEVGTKIQAVREVAMHKFPVGDLEEMLTEIKKGHAPSIRSRF